MKVFNEEQRFTQTWLVVLLVVSITAPIILTIKGYIKENTLMTTNEFVLKLGLILVAASAIFFFKLKTRIDEIGIHYHFFPLYFSMKLISWNEISKVGIRTYYPISEFGGWGLRGGFFFNKGKGRAINVSGNIGIQLVLKNGEKLLIGTQKKNEAIRALETYKNKVS